MNILYGDTNLKVGPSVRDVLYKDTFSPSDYKNRKWQKTGEIWWNTAKRGMISLSVALRIAVIAFAFTVFAANISMSMSRIASMHANFTGEDLKKSELHQTNYNNNEGIEAGRKHA